MITVSACAPGRVELLGNYTDYNEGRLRSPTMQNFISQNTVYRVSQNKPDQNGPAPRLHWRRLASEGRDRVNGQRLRDSERFSGLVR
jgi:hypothetical protein